MVEKTLTDGGLAGANVPADDKDRALVPLAVAAPRRSRAAPRPAAFLAHLIAVKEMHPQTRERRRAEPTEAVSAYRNAMATAPNTPGASYSRAR